MRDFRGVTSGDPLSGLADSFEVAASGGIKCTGGYCASGGSYGTCAIYAVDGKPVCRDCAVKLLDIGAKADASNKKSSLPCRRQSRWDDERCSAGIPLSCDWPWETFSMRRAVARPG